MDRFYNPFAPENANSASAPSKVGQPRQPHPHQQIQPPFQQRQRFRPPRQPGHSGYHRPPYNPTQQRHPRFPHSAPRGQPNFRNQHQRQQFRPRQSNFQHRPHNAQNGGYGNESESEAIHRPWVTPHHLQQIAERNALYERHQATGSEDDLRLFKIKRFEVNQAINDAKIIFLRQNPNEGPQYQVSQMQRSLFTRPKSNAVDTNMPKTIEGRCEKRGAFHCDPCERKFPSQADLDEHLSEHITCKLDGCTYTAHAKLVMKHIDLQHSTGLFSRIQGHDTPEKIAIWRAERKKNWPSSENVARKAAERSEKLARGERLRNNDRGGIGDEEDVFRVRIDRKRPDWRDEEVDNRKRRRRGIEWQSDGDDDFVNTNDNNSRKTDRFQTASSSSNRLVVLSHFYTDIQLLPSSSNSKTKVSGNTRITWTSSTQSQISSGVTPRSADNEEEGIGHSEEVEDGKFCITDDEEESQVVITKRDTIPPEENKPPVSLEPPTVVGLVSYSSCSENEEGEKDDAIPPMMTEGDNEDHHDSHGDHSDAESSSCNDDHEEHHEPQNEVLPSGNKESEAISSDDEPPEEVPTQSAKEPEEPKSSVSESKPKRDEEEGECSSGGEDKPEPDPQPNEEEDDGTVWLENPAVQRLCGYWPSSHSSRLVQRGRRLVKKYTLLQRLLAPDIRKERNIILQACRYIVDNNFFDVEEEEVKSLNTQSISVPAVPESTATATADEEAHNAE